MVFCTNCGNQIEDGSQFCPKCGTPVGAASQAHQAIGMRTAEEIQHFYRNTLQLQEKYIQQYSAGINMLVNSLLPDEVIEFASHGIIGGLQNGTAAEIATTNRRFLIANTPSTSTRMNSAMKGIRRNQIESYRYDAFSGITYQNGLLLGTVNIDFIDGKIIIGVDKKWTQIVYKGLSFSFYQHTGGAY